MRMMDKKGKMIVMAAAFFACGALAGPRVFAAAQDGPAAGEGRPAVQALDDTAGCPYYRQNGRHWRGGRRGCWNQDSQPPCWQGQEGDGNRE